MKALVGALNQEKALVGAFYVIVETDCGTDGSFYSSCLATARYVLSKYVTCVTPSQRRPPTHKTTRKASKYEIHPALQNLSIHQVKTFLHKIVLLSFRGRNFGKSV